MATEIQYLKVIDAVSLHHRLMHEMGQDPSVSCDEGALESALMRPQTAAFYEDADLVVQAARLMTGIALAHPFGDGNKRTALLCGVTFLQLNGLWLDAPGLEIGEQVVAVLTRDDSLGAATDRFVEWLRAHITPLA